MKKLLLIITLLSACSSNVIAYNDDNTITISVGGAVTQNSSNVGGFSTIGGNSSALGTGGNGNSSLNTDDIDASDAGNTICTLPCNSFANNPATAWKQKPCQALLDCLQINASCITANDPLCGPHKTPSYTPPVCGDDYYNAASDNDISTSLTTYIMCVYL